MKPVAFEYERPASVAEACRILAAHGGDAKLIAGGQSLMPMLAMRLARPACLVDIARITELRSISVAGAELVIGAAVRQREIERSALVAERLPLLHKALAWVGHVQTRNRGTLGGSLVHADPSAELPLAACALDATLELRDASGTCQIAAREFFLAPMVSAIAPEQCLERIRFPLWDAPSVRSSFKEMSIRHGDFALASACVQVACDRRGRVSKAALGVGGAGPVPLALPEVAERLVGRVLDRQAIEQLAQLAGQAIEPEGDLHAPAQYRRALAIVLMQRALEEVAQ